MTEKKCPTCGQDIRPMNDTSTIRMIWPKCQAVAQSYGRDWQKLSDTRLRLLGARLRENPGCSPDILWQAMHGAMRYWRQFRHDANPAANLVPETVFRAANFLKYLEHYQEQQARPNGNRAAPQPSRRPGALEELRSQPVATPEERAAASARLADLVGSLGKRMQVPR